jgi:GT2 family glycosyltransferase
MSEQLNSNVDLSVVVVNYNVKEYVANLFASLYRAADESLNMEIYLVDNSSVEGSIPYLKQRYPEVNYIRNTENVGFGKANNLAIEQAKGRFTLIINPDTLVSEDTLKVCMDYMSANPKVGALGCKILNADGSFAPESKRAFPGIWNSFCKASGLTNFFSNSSIFGGYYENTLGENEVGNIAVLSGAFMFFETALLQKLKGFDERFFMYGEDIDLCKRVHEQNREIVYLPTTNIIHYKGESAKQNDITYIKSFNQALYLYFEKHFSTGYLSLLKSVVWIAVWLKIVVNLFSMVINRLRPLMLDLLLINATLTVGYLLRYKIELPQLLEPSYLRFFWTNLVISIAYAFLAPRFGLLKKARYGVVARIQALFFAFLVLVVISFFIKQIAFSRLIVGVSAMVDIALFIIIYTIKKSTLKNAQQIPGNLKTTRLLVVGYDPIQTASLIQKVRRQPGWNYELIGVITQDGQNLDVNEVEGVPIIGNLSQLKELVRAYRVAQVHFMMHALKYKDILEVMPAIGSSENVIVKIVPDSMDYILGKSNVEYLEDIAVIDVELAFFKGLNPYLKRALDIILAIPLWLINGLLSSSKIEETQQVFNEVELTINEGKFASLKLENAQSNTAAKRNLQKVLKAIIKGHMSFVGAPLFTQNNETNFGYKRGLTGLVQINPNSGFSGEDYHSFDLFYLQNYSIWLDLDILVKTILRRPNLFKNPFNKN